MERTPSGESPIWGSRTGARTEATAIRPVLGVQATRTVIATTPGLTEMLAQTYEKRRTVAGSAAAFGDVVLSE